MLSLRRDPVVEDVKGSQARAVWSERSITRLQFARPASAHSKQLVIRTAVIARDKRATAQDARRKKGEQALPKPLVEEMKSTDGESQWHEHQLFCRL